MPGRPAPKLPKNMQPLYEAIVNLTDDVCSRHLDVEYAELARELTAALARKRPSPLLSGKPSTWACGVLYALGQVNFLFDKTEDPHMQAKELCAACGVSTSAGWAKYREIVRAMRISAYDLRWSRPSQMTENPLFWLAAEGDTSKKAIEKMPPGVLMKAFRAGIIGFRIPN